MSSKTTSSWISVGADDDIDRANASGADIACCCGSGSGRASPPRREGRQALAKVLKCCWASTVVGLAAPPAGVHDGFKSCAQATSSFHNRHHRKSGDPSVAAAPYHLDFSDDAQLVVGLDVREAGSIPVARECLG